MMRIAAVAILSLIPALTSAEAPMGPPAPAERATRAIREPEVEARRAWRSYLAGWAVNTASTITAYERGRGDEANPLFKGKPYLAIAAKAVGGVAAWRLDVWAAERGHPRAGRALRWFWLGLSAVVAGWEFSVAF